MDWLFIKSLYDNSRETSILDFLDIFYYDVNGLRGNFSHSQLKFISAVLKATAANVHSEILES